MKKAAKKKVKKSGTNLVLVNFKATEKERAEMKKNAAALSKGNVAALIRRVIANPNLRTGARIRIKAA